MSRRSVVANARTVLATRARRHWRSLLALIVVPPLAYPLALALLLALDSLTGDRVFLHHLSYESRRLLLLTVLRDWAHALPWLYLVVVPLWFAARGLWGRFSQSRPSGRQRRKV